MDKMIEYAIEKVAETYKAQGRVLEEEDRIKLRNYLNILFKNKDKEKENEAIER